jgi:hypothetical protein
MQQAALDSGRGCGRSFGSQVYGSAEAVKLLAEPNGEE